MKIIIMLLLFSMTALAEQGASLGTLRDKKVIELMDKVTTYCEENYPELLKQKDSLFLCYLQLDADSKHAEKTLKDFAYTIRNEARYLETIVVGMQGNASQISKTYIGSEVDKIKNPCDYYPSLAECNIPVSLAAETALDKDCYYDVYSDSDKRVKVCSPKPVEKKRVPAGSK